MLQSWCCNQVGFGLSVSSRPLVEIVAKRAMSAWLFLVVLVCSHNDGSRIEVGPGDAYYFAPGHDGWVLGDEPCVMYEIVESGKDFGPWKHAE